MRAARAFVPDSTRAALIDAATEIFAELGYYDATVRAIAIRAGANVAAIKYHFGDKLGLYTEVLRTTVLAAGHALLPSIIEQAAPPEQILREVIRAFVYRIIGADRAEVRFRLIAHELARPTPALPRLVKQIIQPNYDRLRRLVGSLLGRSPDDEVTCLSTLSIVSQIILYARTGSFFHLLRPTLPLTGTRLERIANHIADFSLASLKSAAA
jgi:TetR/AcrR family transcriptional regulator, regulator of cefoperazone and chloramphenicol sensitivity